MTEPARYLRTGTVPIDQLREFPGNAKRGDIPLILDSLRHNGQYRSVIAREITDDPLLTVLAGNHTMKALALHGPGDCGAPVKVHGKDRPCGVCRNDPSWELAPRVEVVECGDDTARKINLVDNKAAEKGIYDRDALAELLSYMDDDLGGTGYTDADVQLLIAPPPSLEELADTYGDPETDDFWPVLKFRVSPEVRDAFYGLTINCTDTNDDNVRFRYLLDRARNAPDHAA
ncbi:hypothetical protein [Streptomyces salinarius]|uniref:hypothetical protein n=1 Tax=Streptomyces salinarius TaxID=2762598 RepID=UPI002852A4BC|nr:hypothetical protein [Streptomyces salinarius]